MVTSGSNTLTFGHLWMALGPELILTGFALLIMILEMFMGRDRKRSLPWIGLIGVAISFVVTCVRVHEKYRISSDLYITDGFSQTFKLVLLLSLALCLLMVVDYRKQIRLAGEHVYLLLFATVGAMVMASSLDLITLFVGLELLSLSTYILVAMRRDTRSSEAGLKYLVTGGIATATLLYGLSFLYGLTGETNIVQIQFKLPNLWANYHSLGLLSLIFIITGFGIKLSLVPFHMWAPDTYEGAPTPITTYLAVVSKTAVFAMAFRVLLMGVGQYLADWYVYVTIPAVATMIIGNVAALSQRNVKRMLAYSSVAQAGYVLVPLAVLGRATASGNIYQSLIELLFYLTAYALMTVGLFAVVSIVNRQTGSWDISAFTGLYRRKPWLGVCTIIFALSLAGLPLTGGFIGKFYIFTGTLNNNMAWLGGVLFLGSVISFYYYFRIIRATVLPEAMDEASQPALRVSGSLGVVVAVCAVGTVLLGVDPGWLLNFLGNIGWF